MNHRVICTSVVRSLIKYEYEYKYIIVFIQAEFHAPSVAPNPNDASTGDSESRTLYSIGPCVRYEHGDLGCVTYNMRHSFTGDRQVSRGHITDTQWPGCLLDSFTTFSRHLTFTLSPTPRRHILVPWSDPRSGQTGTSQGKVQPFVQGSRSCVVTWKACIYASHAMRAKNEALDNSPNLWLNRIHIFRGKKSFLLWSVWKLYFAL